MKKILVVVDMQKDFIDGALGTVEAVAIVPYVVAKIQAYQENGDCIYFTMDTHHTDYLETQEGANLPVPHCIRGTQGWQFGEGIEALAKKVAGESEMQQIYEKGIFGSAQLAQDLQVIIGEEECVIELVGLCTDICVLSNAILLKTYMPEVKVIVDAKGCAGVTPASHHNALEAMKMCQIQVINQ
ncbi:MAG: cysteine hydrolase family protein [Cellulosilyticaceae bacterium]